MSQNSRKIHQLKSPSKIIDKSLENISSNTNDSFRGFAKRKNIFDQSILLNASTDSCFFTKESVTNRSKSRRGIFSRKEELNQSLSLERSLSKRKNIFKEISPCHSPKFGVRKE